MRRHTFVLRLDNFMDDLDRYCAEVRTRFHGKPLFVYGFSMGVPTLVPNTLSTDPLDVFPTVVDGARGTRFVFDCMKSSKEGAVWVDASFDI